MEKGSFASSFLKCMLFISLVFDSYQVGILLDNHNTAIRIRKLIFGTLLPYNPQTLFTFCQSQKYPLKRKNPAQSHMLHLVVMLLYSPSIWKFLGLSLIFMTLTLLKITGQLFCRMFLNLVCLILPRD